MENDSFYKEEYESTYKIIKKEESFTKVEENDSYYSMSKLYAKELTIPWRAATLESSFPSLNYLKYPPAISLNPWLRQNYKPFLIIRAPKQELGDSWNKGSAATDCNSTKIEVKTSQARKVKREKKTYSRRCKNYVGLLCAGFSRAVLTAKTDDEMRRFIFATIDETKNKFGTLKGIETTSLIESFMAHIYENMCGKKVRKPNRERDFKVRNVADLQNLLMIIDEDNDETCLKKGALRKIVEYFFESDYYNLWLENGMMTAPNRHFFLVNKQEIQKKFLNPGSYKPRFNKTKVKKESF